MKTLFFFLALLLLSSCDKRWEKIHPDEVRTLRKQGSSLKKVLLIGMDGCRTDALLEAKAPAFDSLMAHAYVNLRTDRGPRTLSAPGWSTMFHGVYPEKHGVRNNNLSRLDYGEYHDLLYYMKQYNPNFSTAAVANWNNFLRLFSAEDFAQGVRTDEDVKNLAIDLIKNSSPDILLLHFNDVDYAGHFKGGFRPGNKNYIEAIRQTARYTEEIMKVIHFREKAHAEEWMVLLVTDHGGKGPGHGGQDNVEETRYVFSVIRLPNMNRIDLAEVSTVDIMPTILNFMGVPILSSWDLDGKILF
jgi:predicted AlkP superfamily pyrophosphatase or phosphodiesterase